MNRIGVKGISLLVSAAVVMAGCTRSPETRSAAYIEAGKKLLKQNDSTRAILQFRNAVGATPKNAEVYYQLSLAYASAGDVKMTIGTLQKALELNPAHTAARLRMAQIMTMASDPKYAEEARASLRKLLEESPDNVEALHSLAMAELKLSDTGGAVEHLTRAMVLAPQNLGLAVSMAQIRLQQNDTAGAEAILRKAAEQNRQSADAAIVLGRFLGSQRRWTEAEQEFMRAVGIDRNNEEALYNLATVQRAAGQTQQAEATLKRLSAMSGKTYRSAYGVFLFQEGRKDEAIRELESLAKQDPDDRGIRTRLIAAYRNSNRSADAEKVLTAALKRNPKDSEALLQRAELLLAEKKYNQVEIDLDQVLRFQPDWAEAHYIYAKLRQARNESYLYREELMKALQLDPTMLPIRLEAVQNMLSTNDGKAALALIDETPEPGRKLPQVIVQRNWALWSLGDMAEMRKGIDTGLALGTNADLLLQDGVWKLRAGQFAAARVSLEKALNINPGDIRALGALSESYKAQKQNTIALQKVKEYALRQPHSAAVQEFLGVMLMAEGDRRGARAAFVQAQAVDPKFVAADLSLTQTDIAEGRTNDAERRLNSLLASDPANTTAKLWLANLEISKGNKQDALEHLKSVLNSEPNNVLALNNYAYLLTEFKNDPGSALAFAQRAKELSPGDPAYSDTLGWILYRKGLFSMAVSELEAAAKGADPVPKYHLAMAYAKVGDVNHGQAMLQDALKLNPNLPEAKMAQEVVGPTKR